MSFWQWLGGFLGGKDVNISPKASVKLEFLNNLGSTNKRVAKFVNKGTVNVIQLPANPTPEQVQALQPIREAVFDTGEISLITAEQKQTVHDVLAHEADPHVSSLLRYFKKYLTGREYQLLRTGLYLRHLRVTQQKEEATKVWKQVRTSCNSFERRLVNVASANYFQDLLRPQVKLLEQEKRDPGYIRQRLHQWIEELTFVLFVQKDNTPGEIADLFFKKAIRNITYGVSHDTINIHGMGHTVRTVEGALELIKPKFPKINVHRSSLPGSVEIIKAIVYYKDNNLTDDDFNSN